MREFVYRYEHKWSDHISRFVSPGQTTEQMPVPGDNTFRRPVTRVTPIVGHQTTGVSPFASQHALQLERVNAVKSCLDVDTFSFLTRLGLRTWSCAATSASVFFCMRRSMLRKPLLREGVRLCFRPSNSTKSGVTCRISFGLRTPPARARLSFSRTSHVASVAVGGWP